MYWGSVGGKGASFVLQAIWENEKISAGVTIPFAAVKPAENALPNEVLVLKEGDKQYLYVSLNGNNTVVKMDLATKAVVWTTNVGVAPFGITTANGKLYVTNWAGGQPDAKDTDVAGVPWGAAKVYAENGATREGSVSVLDPKTGAVLKEIVIGLHPNDVIASNDVKFVFVSNANSDAISTISTSTDAVTETISVRLSPEKNNYWGDSPNGLAISKDDKVLYVANGMDNALAVVSLGEKSATGSVQKESVVKGFIPTGAYPGAISVTGGDLLYVANIEAEGAHISSIQEGSTQPAYNSHKQIASVSVIPVPDESTLKAYTQKVENSNQLFRLALTAKLPRKNVKPVPVPERIGEPSVFKHVLYIIKENRTYDQILGGYEKRGW